MFPRSQSHQALQAPPCEAQGLAAGLSTTPSQQCAQRDSSSAVASARAQSRGVWPTAEHHQRSPLSPRSPPQPSLTEHICRAVPGHKAGVIPVAHAFLEDPLAEIFAKATAGRHQAVVTGVGLREAAQHCPGHQPAIGQHREHGVGRPAAQGQERGEPPAQPPPAASQPSCCPPAGRLHASGPQRLDTSGSLGLSPTKRQRPSTSAPRSLPLSPSNTSVPQRLSPAAPPQPGPSPSPRPPRPSEPAPALTPQAPAPRGWDYRPPPPPPRRGEGGAPPAPEPPRRGPPGSLRSAEETPVRAAARRRAAPAAHRPQPPSSPRACRAEGPAIGSQRRWGDLGPAPGQRACAAGGPTPPIGCPPHLICMLRENNSAPLPASPAAPGRPRFLCGPRRGRGAAVVAAVRRAPGCGPSPPPGALPVIIAIMFSKPGLRLTQLCALHAHIGPHVWRAQNNSEELGGHLGFSGD